MARPNRIPQPLRNMHYRLNRKKKKKTVGVETYLKLDHVTFKSTENIVKMTVCYCVIVVSVKASVADRK